MSEPNRTIITEKADYTLPIPKTAEDFDQDDFEDEFLEWLYDNYPIGNNHMLIAHLEDPARFESFLESKGLI